MAGRGVSARVQGELWGSAAEDWAGLQEPMGRPLWEVMLRQARVDKGTTLLDAGCGAAGACLLASKRGARVSGLDASEGLVAIARRRVPDGDFRVGDLEALPYRDGTFEAVMAANSIQFVSSA